MDCIGALMLSFGPKTIPKVWGSLFELIRQGKFRGTVFEERFEG